MCARFISALAGMILLSAAGTAMAKTQPATAGSTQAPDGQHSQDQGVSKAAEHGQSHQKSDGDSNGDDQGNNNQGENDQGDDNGQHKDRGHHFGESGTRNGEQGEHNGKGMG